MTVELCKLELAVRGHTDIEQLRKLGLHLVATMRALDKRCEGPDNYSVAIHQDNAYFTIADGTKEYCKGYCDSRCDNSIVVCHDMVVYPEDRWGEYVDIKE
jgi:hypothetical protein